MTSKTYLSVKITDDDRVKVDINGYSDTMALFCLFFKNVAKEVFNIDL